VVPEESKARYRVPETFLRDMQYNVAVGRTRRVDGEVPVNRRNPAASRVGPIVVDFSTLESDSPRRGNAIRERWLESARFPTAPFVSTAIRDAPPAYRKGEPVELVGNLTVREVTRPVTCRTTVRSWRNSRSSWGAAQVPAIFTTHSIAASREGSSRMQKPPSEPLVSG